MPEQHAEVRALIVGRDPEAAVHVGMTARLVTEESAHKVDPLGRCRRLAPFSHGRSRDLADVTDDDPERLPGRVVVHRPHFHRR